MALKAGRVGVYPEDLDKEGHIKQNETDPYVLPIATSEVLGGVKPVAKTNEMTQDVGVDSNGKLYSPAPSSYVLPTATSEVLGGVKPVAKTSEMTQDVGVDSAGKLYTSAPSSGSGMTIYYKDFSLASSGPGGIDHFGVTSSNVAVTGYVPIGAAFFGSSYAAMAGIGYNKNGDNKPYGFAWGQGVTSSGSKVRIYYVADSNVEAFSS